MMARGAAGEVDARAGRWVYALPMLSWLAITLPTIGQGDYGSDSAWYTAIGVQAWRTGELWTLWGPPGQAYFNKPPMAFWVHGLFAWVLGPGVWQARLPSVIAGLMCVMLTVRLARGFVSGSSACAAGLVLAFTYEFFRRSLEVSLDVWQLMFMLAACVAVGGMGPSIVRGGGASRGRWLAAGACVGLALLCKPLMALLAVPLLALWRVREARRANQEPESQTREGSRQPHIAVSFAGACVLMLIGALVVAGPWHVSMLMLHQDFAGQYFGAEVAARAAGDVTAGPQWTKPWWFYLEQLGTTGWPWLALALLGGLDLVLAKLRPGARPLARWAVLWALVWLVVLSVFPDRRDRYAVVVHPALSVLAACWLDSKRAYAWRGRGLCNMATLVAMGAGAALLVVMVSGGRVHRRVDAQWPALIAMLREGVPPGENGTPRVWAAGLAPDRGARVYLEFGWWPKPTRDRWQRLVIEPSRDVRPGDWLIYHRRDGWLPGAGEREVWRERDLTITTLEPGAAWSPVRVVDPGE